MNVFRSNSNAIVSEHRRYNLRGTLKGHRGAVACIAAHPLGFYLASGGKDGTRIWQLSDAKSLSRPTGAADRGITTAIVWLTKPDNEDEGLAFGTEHGYLCIWQRNKDKNGFSEIWCDRLTGGKDGTEIAAMAYDTNSGQLAVVHRAEAIHRFVIDEAMVPRVISSVTISKHWPQAVAFGQVGVRGPEVWTFGREDGVVYILDDAGKILKKKTTGIVIGHAVLNTKEDAIILDDVSEGVALFKMGGTERVKTFEVPHRECRSRNVAFLDGTSTIISGSDHGSVYAFDRRTGEVIDRINIGVKDWVQSISTVEASGIPLIFVGRSGENVGRADIQVWEKVVTTPRDNALARSIWEEGRWLLLVTMSILFILENVLEFPVLSYSRQWMNQATEQVIYL